MTNVHTISWKSAVGLSCLTVYAPFIVMATYTLLFVSCTHCKTTACTLLPCAPGLLPIEAARRLLDWPRPGDILGFALAFVMSLALIFVLAFFVRRSRWVRLAGVAVALAAFSIVAFCTLSMIRA